VTLGEDVRPSDVPRDVTLVRRAMEAMSIGLRVGFLGETARRVFDL
jgi:hypothetical protein